ERNKVMSKRQQKINQNKEWYKHGWGLVAAILFFPYFLVWYAWAKSKWSKGVKVALTATVAIIMMPILISMARTDTTPQQNASTSDGQHQDKSEPKKEEPTPKTTQEIMLEKISGLIASKEAFDTGSYVKGDIPVGDYAFISFEGSGKYYSEEDSAGNIID